LLCLALCKGCKDKGQHDSDTEDRERCHIAYRFPNPKKADASTLGIYLPPPDPLPHSHQRLPQQIHPPLPPTPLRLRLPKPHPPHPIPGTRLHQLPLPRRQQPLPQPPFPPLKLQPTPLYHNFELHSLPLLRLRLPPLHLPPQTLLLSWISRGEDRARGGGVGAEEGFGVHHALLGAVVGCVAGRVVEGGEEPLGEEAVGGGGYSRWKKMGVWSLGGVAGGSLGEVGMFVCSGAAWEAESWAWASRRALAFWSRVYLIWVRGCGKLMGGSCVQREREGHEREYTVKEVVDSYWTLFRQRRF